MTMMSGLPKILEDEILSRIPISSLKSMRSTCKKWNAFSKAQIIGKAAKESLGLTLKEEYGNFNYKLCSLSFNLQGIRNDDLDVKIGIKQVSIPDDVKIYCVIHCDGLLLCLVEDNSSILVWNPYLAQTRWIQAKHCKRRVGVYGLGYDNNRNHKILRILDDDDDVSGYGLKYEIFRFNSSSWSRLDITPDLDGWANICDVVSLKGNSYFFVYGWNDDDEYDDDEEEDEDGELQPQLQLGVFIICFDFTTENFGEFLVLPVRPYVGENVTLSCVREEQLMLLYNGWRKSEILEIWVSDKIDPNAVSWTMFLKVDTTQLPRFPYMFNAVSFFIDEEKKVAVAFNRNVAYIIGEDGYSKSVNIRDGPDRFCPYVPSLVELQTKPPGERKRRACKTKRKKNVKKR